MKPEYDFRSGARGKFFKPNAKLHLPVYLDESIEKYLAARAQTEGIGLSELVNELLRKEIELIEAGK